MTDIFIPIETINRELDYKLILSCMLAQPDQRVFLGSSEAIEAAIRNGNGGIYIGKAVFQRGTREQDKAFINSLKEHDIAILYVDEEGGVFPGKHDMLKQFIAGRAEPSYLGEADYFTTWGTYQAEYFSRLVGDGSGPTIRAIGTPRFNILQPNYTEFYAPEAKKLRDKYGKYLLINGSLGLANHKAGTEFVFNSGQYVDKGDPKKLFNLLGRWREMTYSLASMVEMIFHLSFRFPTHKIIIRSHPSENDDFYRGLFAGIPNVMIIHEGPVVPWILASDAVIHNNCTTGIEAMFAQIPAVNFNPHKSENMVYVFFEELGCNVQDIDQLVEMVNGFITHSKDMIQLPDKQYVDTMSNQMILNFTGIDSFAAIVSIVDEMIQQRGKKSGGNLGYMLRKRRWQNAYNSLKRNYRYLSSDYRKRYQYAFKKFGRLNGEYLEQKIDYCRAQFDKPIEVLHRDEALLVVTSPARK